MQRANSQPPGYRGFHQLPIWNPPGTDSPANFELVQVLMDVIGRPGPVGGIHQRLVFAVHDNFVAGTFEVFLNRKTGRVGDRLLDE